MMYVREVLYPMVVDDALSDPYCLTSSALHSRIRSSSRSWMIACYIASMREEMPPTKHQEVRCPLAEFSPRNLVPGDSFTDFLTLCSPGSIFTLLAAIRYMRLKTETFKFRGYRGKRSIPPESGSRSNSLPFISRTFPETTHQTHKPCWRT